MKNLFFNCCIAVFIKHYYAQVGVPGHFSSVIQGFALEKAQKFDWQVSPQGVSPNQSPTTTDLFELPYFDNDLLLQDEIDKNTIITASGRDTQVVYLKGGSPSDLHMSNADPQSSSQKENPDDNGTTQNVNHSEKTENIPATASASKQPQNTQDNPASDINIQDAIPTSSGEVIIPGPFTFGKKVSVDLDAANIGAWTFFTFSEFQSTFPFIQLSENFTSSDPAEGLIKYWTLTIRSPNAFSLSLLFDKFKLPNDSELYVYNRDGLVLGAFTPQVNNKDDMKFATAPLPGNLLILDFFQIVNKSKLASPPTASSNTENDLILHISGIVHGFRNIFPGRKNVTQKNNIPFNDKNRDVLTGISGSCNINVSCSAGLGWHDQIRSVVVFMTSEGQKFCSGAMVNNVLQDGKQYFLTANHCVDDPNTDYRYSMLGFNYEAPSCDVDVNASIFPVSQAAHGLLLRAKLRNSDFALFELQENIPASYNVYMAGWSIAKTVPPGTGACIHHPSGDVKKISLTSAPIIMDCWTECPRRWHWRITKWDKGVTEPGSSGSPFFSSDKLIIGQLHGGGSSCGNPLGYDVYGALFASYNSGLAASQRLIDWLNPRKDPRIISVKGAYLNDIRRRSSRSLNNTAGLSEDKMEQDGIILSAVQPLSLIHHPPEGFASV